MAQEFKKLGITAKKNENFSEWFTQVCSEQGAQLVDIRYGVQGCLVHRPWAFRILRKIYDLLEAEVEKDGHEPLLFPTFIPEENLQKEKEHAGFTPEVFWVTEAGDQKLDRKLALRPTGETAFYPMYSLWIKSYNDLPLKCYQSRMTVFRNEMTTRPFLRGREFMFFETHDVFATHEGALEQIKKDMETMEKVVWDKLRIPFIFFRRPQWDKFKGANDTYASDSLLPDGRRSQISSTHDLGQKFAKAFDVKFTDENGKTVYGWQTCFGPGIWRIMASLIAVHGDDKGLILPFFLAPVQIVIIPIIFAGGKDNEKVMQFSKQVEKMIKDMGFSVKLDGSTQTPGFKFNQWEMMGVPIKIEVGPKEVAAEKITMSYRTGTKKETFGLTDFKKTIEWMAEQLDKDIKKRADEYFKENTKEAKTIKDVQKIIKTHRGFVKIPFCTNEIDGKKCAEILKAETGGADVCGVNYKEKETASGKCAVCEKPAREIVYVAKSI